MTTQPIDDDSYPSAWTPAHIRERDNALDTTEAELWLSSLSPAELQAVLLRTRGRR